MSYDHAHGFATHQTGAAEGNCTPPLPHTKRMLLSGATAAWTWPVTLRRTKLAKLGRDLSHKPLVESAGVAPALLRCQRSVLLLDDDPFWWTRRVTLPVTMNANHRCCLQHEPADGQRIELCFGVLEAPLCPALPSMALATRIGLASS